MALPKYQKLRQKASIALRAGDLDGALHIYGQLENLMPDDPLWPERRAGVYRQQSRSADALTSLQRALELQIDAGEVLAAIATCKGILEIEADHPATLECLNLLYTEPAMNPGDRVISWPEEEALDERTSVRPDVAPPSSSPPSPERHAPLVELELTEMIPGSRSVQLTDAEVGSVAEIPLDPPRSDSEMSSLLDLRAQPEPAPKASTAPPSSTRDAARTGASPEPTGRVRRSARQELANMPLFGSLEPSELLSLMSEVRVVQLAAGDTLFREGDPADSLYVVVDGAVVPIAEGEHRLRLSVLEHGAFCGEIGLVTNQPRNATIEALVETKLLAIDRSVVWSLMRGRPEMSKVMLRFLRERLIDRQIRTSPFFEAFANADRAEVAKLFRFLEVKNGAVVVSQGQPVEGLFVLLAGQMQVLDAERDKSLAELHSGDIFGAASLLHSRPAAASVVARGKCWVLVLGEGRFRRIMQASPKLEALLSQMSHHGGSDESSI